MSSPAPEPPLPLPPGLVVHVPGRGEFFVRDTAPAHRPHPGEGPPILLLHGWMFASDMNWWPVYDALAGAGHRVLAMDLRGHGRGLRTSKPFSLRDCAEDAAALIAHLDCGPVVAVGYSMGGPVAELMARDHPDTVSGLVLSATALHWHGVRMQLIWNAMGVLRLGLGAFPTKAWELLLKPMGTPPGTLKSWLAAEVTRGSSADIAEAGRELGRYDASSWIAGLRDIPSAVIVTARDRSVLPRRQRQLAERLGAEVSEIEADHLAVVTHQREFRRLLLEAVRTVSGARAGTAAAA